MRTYATLVLAAGRSSRYRAAGGAGPTKLVADFRGKPLVRHAVEAATGSCATPVIVVTGHAAPVVEAALAGLPLSFVHNPHFADGLAGSLQAGLSALPTAVAGAVVLLGDMPLVSQATIDALMAAAAAAPEADAVVPLWGGERGNPVLLARSLFARAAGLRGDEGARKMLREPDLHVVELPFADDAIRLDVDEPDALAAVEGRVPARNE